MKFATAAVVFFAAKAIAAPAAHQERGYQYDVVDVTVTQYATVTQGGAYNAYAAPQSTPCPEGQQAKPKHHRKPHNKPQYYNPAPQQYGGNNVVKTITYVYGGGYGYGQPPAYTQQPKPHKPHHKPKPKPKPYSAPKPYTPPSTPSYGGNSFAQKIVAKHNQLRALHGAGPLQWDDNLANFAQNNMSPQCVMQHTPNGPNGENLAFGYGDTDAAIQAWYDENQYYNYNQPGFTDQTGHFTALVWKATTHVGCYLQSGCNYLKCEYQTPGNVEGGNGGNQYFRENVLPN